MNPRYRIYAAVGLAGVVLLGGGFMLMGRGGSNASSAAPVIKPLHPVSKAKKTASLEATRKTAPKKAAKKVVKTAKATAKTPLAPPSVPKTDAARDGMPAALAQALKTHSVVVVSLVVPDATVDDLSYQEAKAGAAKAGAGFVKISAGNDNDVEALSTLVNANADAGNRLLDAPAVLIFRQPQDLYVRINGYIDADTIAQAAANAAPVGKVASGQSELSSAWVTAANATCDKFNAEMSSTALPTQADQVLPFVRGLLAKLRTTVATLHGLKPPPGAKARVATMLADYDEMLKDVDAELSLEPGNFTALRALDAKARAAGTRGDAIAAALGATSCSGRWS